VVTPGWTLDEKGQAMSKSRGNDVDPVDISSRLGGEVVRLWVASVDFREDVVGSEALMQRVGENYREIRNKLFKNALGNLYDFDPQKNTVPFEKMDPLDQYMLRQTWSLTRDVRKWYDDFAFHKIYHRVNHFCVVELSAFYFDVIKDRLYTYAPNSMGRRSGQTAIWRIYFHLRGSVATLAQGAGQSGKRAHGSVPQCRRSFRGIGFRERSPDFAGLGNVAECPRAGTQGAGRGTKQ
jgi:isoleucyl-tRNA synthetase